jgi:hypothetical protein
MTGENLFKTFEEEHLETPSLPRYNTWAAYQHSAHSIQHHAPHIFHPIAFTTAHGCPIAQRAVNPTPMANGVINQYTGTSLEYRQLIQNEAMFPI